MDPADLSHLLKVTTTPEGTAHAIAALKEHIEAHNKAKSEAEAAQLALRGEKQLHHARENKITDQERWLNEREAVLVGKEKAIEAQIADARRITDEARQVKIEVDALVSTVGRRESALRDRETRVVARESAVNLKDSGFADREARVAAREAEAEALRDDYRRKLDELRKIVA